MTIVPARPSQALIRSDLVRRGFILKPPPRSPWRNPHKGIHRHERDYHPNDPAAQNRAARWASRERDYEAGLIREPTGDIVDSGGQWDSDGD